MKDRSEEERARDEFISRELLPPEYRKARQAIEQEERELRDYRNRQMEREKALQQELEAREKHFSERERKLVERQRDFEQHLARREDELAVLRDEAVIHEHQLRQALAELQSEKDRYKEENREKIERTSKDYVADALETLDKKEKQFHRISKIWSCIGAGSIIGGIGFFVYISLTTALALPVAMTWELLAFAVFKGLIAVALLAGLAKYSFMFSSRYMQESLKNADRRHAINFGKFYLESYGAAAEWSQVKEAFEHWNIAGSNAFDQAGESLPDISALEKAVALIERANKALPRPKLEASA